jgi:hypothetical protein
VNGSAFSCFYVDDSAKNFEEESGKPIVAPNARFACFRIRIILFGKRIEQYP